MVSQGRPERQSDYSRMPSHRPLVIDNGAYFCRVGWAGEKDPRFSFHNVLHRPRHRGSGELTSIVGDYDSGTVKLFDFTRSSLRSAFDGNVVYQFETMESVRCCPLFIRFHGPYSKVVFKWMINFMGL
jgi:actin-related protein 5